MTDVKSIKTDILVIGAGAAGLAAASAAADFGLDVLLADERSYPGGVLPQCIHSGFGQGRYGRDMTGPEYCEEEFRRFTYSGAAYLPDTRILSIEPGRTAAASSPGGLSSISFKECILAAGCVERSIWSLPVSGTRPSGVYTAGEAQEMINLGHYDIGDRVFILGSGDIGQIMARRFILSGKTVVGMAEQNSCLGGLKRNQRECIEAYNVPVILNATVTEIHGYPALTGVTVHHFDTDNDTFIGCDTLITAIGLQPDKELAEPLLSERGCPEWLHICGNADFVHEIADGASAQGENAGKTAAEHILNR